MGSVCSSGALSVELRPLLPADTVERLELDCLNSVRVSLLVPVGSGLRGQRSRVSWIQILTPDILTPDMPPPGKSDHRAESAAGGRGETLDGVAARGGVSEQPGLDRHPGRCPGVPVTAGGGLLEFHRRSRQQLQLWQGSPWLVWGLSRWDTRWGHCLHSCSGVCLLLRRCRWTWSARPPSAAASAPGWLSAA